MNRQEIIRAKGFDMMQRPQTEYGHIKSGTKQLADAVINLGAIEKSTKGYISKGVVLKALFDNDVQKLREISNYFYKTNGIYQRLCNYVATMYRYDWYVVPEVYKEGTKGEEIIKDLHKVLNFMDNSYISKICGEMALGVVKNGAYYGYLVPTSTGVIVQELPINYCRARYNVGNLPAVEFNMRFFDVAFPDTNYRMKVLNLFPEEFKKGYHAYKRNLLKDEYTGTSSGIISSEWRRRDESGWWQLDPDKTVKFSFPNGGNGAADLPLFINVIPAILDLDAAQDLDRRKQMQKLLKIVVQKLPLDKNGDLIFDVDEARDIHNNAVEMLRRAVGVDVLTTFADIESIDMSDKNTTATQDDLAKVERAVYNASGTSQNMFNTDGNMALEKSVLNDEGMVRALLLQFEVFFDRIAQSKSANRKKYNFRLYMLETTQYNYKELAKMYKEQVQLGYSKMLPQIAMGHSQSSILNTAYFENEVMNLSELMIPPLMSSTLNMQDLKGGSGSTSSSGSQKSSGSSGSSSGSAGRPEKPDDQKSEKTIKNKESMS